MKRKLQAVLADRVVLVECRRRAAQTNATHTITNHAVSPSPSTLHGPASGIQM